MSGVFVNYRVVDNPLGAASIHDALVGRFGANRVFRDCVSIEAGTHYPSAIRDALAEADVLVSVIGPDWLALTDETTGERLIDRDDDWVRKELVVAHARTIPVVPVLLVNTPANAVSLTPEDLPPDLRWLAQLQTFEFNQRRFGEDLDRLAARLAALAPSLTNGRTYLLPDVRQLSPAAFTELAAALEAVPCMMNDSTRGLVVGQLRPSISGVIPHYPQRRMHVAAILRTCLDYEDGLSDLLRTIANFEQKDSVSFQRLAATVTRLEREWRG